MKLYLITHAHTAQVPDMDVTRWVLSEQGMEQARLLAQQPFWDEVGQIALSLEEKTYLTVESVLANREVVYFHDRRFNELKRGGWVGNYAERVQQAFGKPDEAAGDWEPASHALQRFQKGMADLCQKYAEETVAVVGHGLTMSLYRASRGAGRPCQRSIVRRFCGCGGPYATALVCLAIYTYLRKPKQPTF